MTDLVVGLPHDYVHCIESLGSAEENVAQLFCVHEERAQPKASKHASIFAPKKY